MTHHHHHAHHTVESSLSFNQKLMKLLQHWIRHNEDHAATYRDWGMKAEENHIAAAGALIKEAAQMTQQINEKFKAAINLLEPLE